MPYSTSSTIAPAVTPSDRIHTGVSQIFTLLIMI